jgi:dipeptidase D
LKDFASKHGAEYSEDSIGNAKLFKRSSSASSSNNTVVLQGHIDMVTEANKDKKHNFETDPITLQRVTIENEEWIKADGTTLGADNAVGVSMGLSLISNPPDNIKLPNIEVLCTIDEEVGMTGAMYLDSDFLTGKILLNLDSEEDGIFTISCAGGQDLTGYYTIEKIESQIASSDAQFSKLLLTGLSGGHSGVQIHEPRANAIKLVSDLLKTILLAEKSQNKKFIEIREFRAGSKLNAIPREAEVSVIVNKSNSDELQKIIDNWASVVDQQWKFDTVKIVLSSDEAPAQTNVWSTDFASRFTNILLGIPHGVISMNPDIPRLVQTSTNLALVSYKDDNEIFIGTSQRSSNNSAVGTTGNIVRAVMELGNAKECIVTDPYPAWQPCMDSPILQIASSVFERIHGKKPKIEAIHAGLECGLLGERVPGLDMISFGPTIVGAHSPDERIRVASVQYNYDLLLHILTELASN